MFGTKTSFCDFADREEKEVDQTTISAFLQENPTIRIAVVGHTDSVGALNANIALSKKRARAVRDRLTGRHDIAANRIEAEGMGYLAPIASNLTEEGRRANRRVEIILLSGE